MAAPRLAWGLIAAFLVADPAVSQARSRRKPVQAETPAADSHTDEAPSGSKRKSRRKKNGKAVGERAPVDTERAEGGSAPDWDYGFDEPEAPPPAPATPSEPAGQPSHANSPVKISGVLFDGQGPGEPDPAQCIRLTNTDRAHPADVGDFAVSDMYGPPRTPVQPARSDANSPRRALLPSGTRIPPGGELWIAVDGATFRRLQGFNPDFEGRDTLGEVPQVGLEGGGWPTWNALRGVVSLHDASGDLVDVVPYERGMPRDMLEKSGIPRGSWSGPAVVVFRSSPFGWSGQILARDRDPFGNLVADTNTAADWDSGFSRTQLGRDSIHRIEYPGQSRLVFEPLRGENAELVCASAPENAFAALRTAVEGARHEILVRIYQFENDYVADLLVAAKRRGVKVVVYAEGSPVGGLPDQERYIAERLHSEGIPVWFLAGRPDQRPRYRFDHSKYLLVDGEWAIIATENFGYTGHPVDPSRGNRGWMVHVRSKAFAAQLRRVWDADLAPERHRDLIEVAEDPADTWGLPYRKPPFELFRSVPRGSYPLRRPVLRVKAPMNLELVACPDNCLAEDRALIGLLRSARESLFVLQNSIPLWWGKKDGGSVEETPNLPLAAVIDAARRGVRVRVLLDGTWYNTEPYDPRDNDDTVRYLNDLGRREHLNLEAKVVNLVSTRLEKIHAKGVVADGRRVFVGSINWTENSFKGNREIGVVVDNADAATYYASLFQRDWATSRLYRIRVARDGGMLRTRPLSTSAALRKAAAGEVMEVMAENGPWLEVRVSATATAYLPAAAAEEVLAAPEETPAVVGRAARVRGRVKSTHVGRDGVYLNFGENWKSDFSVFLPQSALGAFRAAGVDPPGDLEGREVEARGKLYEKDGPQMRVETPDLLDVLD